MATVIIHSYKADARWSGGDETNNLQISFEQTPPEMNGVDAYAKFYTEQGEKLANALFDHLPGGLVDALLVELMTRRKSLLRVSFTE